MGTKEEKSKNKKNPIFIVDDDLDVHEFMKIAAEQVAYDCVFAGDSKEMASLLNKYIPSLIVMDVGLPDQDGLTLVRGIKAVPRLANIPLIVISAHLFADSISLVDQARNLGCDEFIRKPIGMTSIINVFTDYLLKNNEAKRG